MARELMDVAMKSAPETVWEGSSGALHRLLRRDVTPIAESNDIAGSIRYPACCAGGTGL